MIKTNIETLRKANWDDLEQQVVTRIRLLKGMAEKLEPNELNNRIAQDLIGPCLELLGQFCLSIELEGEEKKK